MRRSRPASRGTLSGSRSLEVGEVGGGAEVGSRDGLAAGGVTGTAGARAEEDDLGDGVVVGMRCRATRAAGGVTVARGEGVVEDALDGLGGLLVGVEGKVFVLVKAQGAEVVHAEDVVGVAVSVRTASRRWIRSRTAWAWKWGLCR